MIFVLIKLVIMLLSIIQFIIALIRNIVCIPYYTLDLIHRYIQFIIDYLNRKYILLDWTDKVGLIGWITFNMRITYVIWRENTIHVLLRHLEKMRKEGYNFIQVYFQISFYAFIFSFLIYILINIYLFDKF